jgi:hypothetical protein
MVDGTLIKVRQDPIYSSFMRACTCVVVCVSCVCVCVCVGVGVCI